MRILVTGSLQGWGLLLLTIRCHEPMHHRMPSAPLRMANWPLLTYR